MKHILPFLLCIPLALTTLSEKVQYVSDVNSPVEVIETTSSDPAAILATIHRNPFTPIELVDYPQFYVNIIDKSGSWDDLLTWVNQNMTDIHMWKVGHIQVDYFITGHYHGEVLVLHFYAIET